MTHERGIFRVYKCPKCSFSSLQQVESEVDATTCEICSSPIVDSPDVSYAATRDEAQHLLADIMRRKRAERENRTSTKGLGVRRRLLRIVDALVDTNRGRPVHIEAVMRDATEAGIDLSKATRILYELIEQGSLLQTDKGIILSHGGIFVE